MRFLWIVIASLLICNSNALAASTGAVSLYGAQGLDQDFWEIMGGEMKRDKSYLAAIDLTFPITEKEFFDHIRFDFHLIMARHWGLQDNFELDISPSIQLFDILPQNRVGNLALTWGIGLSYAFGTPTYEDGPIDDPDKRYRFQGFMLLDLELYHRREQLIRPFIRLHHRSGIYGLIAPKRVGSNFFAIGIRF